jgi:pyridoxamine 5'-phosphate oxidase family protein
MIPSTAERAEHILTESEACFLCRGGLARLATVSSDGQPHVVPVAYEFDGQSVYFSGRDLSRTLKFRHILDNQKVALVVDEVVSVSPWRARGVEIRGVAEVLHERGHAYVRVSLRSKASWGL